jgi:hypothetical protein
MVRENGKRSPDVLIVLKEVVQAGLVDISCQEHHPVALLCTSPRTTDIELEVIVRPLPS